MVREKHRTYEGIHFQQRQQLKYQGQNRLSTSPFDKKPALAYSKRKEDCRGLEPIEISRDDFGKVCEFREAQVSCFSTSYITVNILYFGTRFI
jgi:hypothetical protein